MSLRIQVKPNDDATVDFINEKPVIGKISTWTTARNLFTSEDLANLSTDLANLYFIDILVLEPDESLPLPITLNPNNAIDSAFVYVPTLPITGELTQDVLMWISGIDGVTFQAKRLSASGDITDVTEELDQKPVRIVDIDSANIQFIKQEE